MMANFETFDTVLDIAPDWPGFVAMSMSPAVRAKQALGAPTEADIFQAFGVPAATFRVLKGRLASVGQFGRWNTGARFDAAVAVFGYPSLVHRAVHYQHLTDAAADGFHTDLKQWLKSDPRRWCSPTEIGLLIEKLRVAEAITSRRLVLDQEGAALRVKLALAHSAISGFQGRGNIATIVTPTGPVTVLRTVAERLLAEGVISGTIGEGLHAADAATVKAAVIAAAGICDFCSAPGGTNAFDVPDFDMPVLPALRSTDGWGACDVCADLIHANRRDALLKRSLDGLSFSKFSVAAVQELHARFWRAMDDKADAAGIAAAFGDYINDTITWPEGVTKTLTDRDQRVEAIVRLTGLDRSKALALTRGELDSESTRTLAAWGRKWHGRSDGPTVAREIARELEAGAHKPLPTILPHWQVALDMRFEAAKAATRLASDNVPAQHFSPNETDLTDEASVRRIVETAEMARQAFAEHNRSDVKALRHAETYSFNAETAQAITLAASSIPRDSPLSAVETPGNGRAGWFWFQAPLPVCTTGDAAATNALLWYWDERDGQPELRISAYALDRRTGALVPAAYWAWGRRTTLHGLLAEVHRAYDQGQVLVATDHPFGRDETVKGIADLSLFFLAACLWMKERVVVAEAGHIERHARKRYVREHKLADPPSVQVIALRKSYREPGTSTPAAGAGHAAREWQHRWIVDGHPRLQPCGPGRADRKLIWINPYPKGPEGKPLLVRKRVFAVVR